MRFSLRRMAPLAALLLASPPVLAHDVTVGSLTIVQPWSRATPGGAKVAVGYLTIKNGGDQPDRLTGIASDVAEKASPHTMTMTGGMMQMRPIVGGLIIPAHGAVTLKPAGDHLMFEGLKHPLTKGETFAATLTFEKAGSIPVEFEVEGIGAQAPAPMTMKMD